MQCRASSLSRGSDEAGGSDKAEARPLARPDGRPLLAGLGLLLLDEARSTSVSPAAAKAVAGSAVILAGVDMRYGGPGRISRVYLLDAVVEVVLALAWAAARNR